MTINSAIIVLKHAPYEYKIGIKIIFNNRLMDAPINIEIVYCLSFRWGNISCDPITFVIPMMQTKGLKIIIKYVTFEYPKP